MSLQVAASPCCVKALPNAISVVLPCVPGPLLQLLPRCFTPVSSPGTLAFPEQTTGRRLASLHHCYFGWRAILELQSSFTFRPTSLLASQVAPTLPLIKFRAAETFTAAHITVGYLPRAAAMLTIQYRAIDGKGTRTPQVRQPCWPLRLLALVSLIHT